MKRSLFLLQKMKEFADAAAEKSFAIQRNEFETAK